MPPRRPRIDTATISCAMPSVWHTLTDEALLQRGAEYFVRGKVQRTAPHDHRFRVDGSSPYDVSLNAPDPLQCSCTCPHARRAPVCKHMVAAWLLAYAPEDVRSSLATPATQPPAQPAAPTIASKPSRSTAKIRAQDAMAANVEFMRSRTPQQLSDWIAAQCARDPLLAQQLTLWRSQSESSGMTPAQWRSLLVQAMPSRRSGIWGRELTQWAKHALATLQPLKDLLATHPASLRTGCSLALLRLFKQWETADDSQGQLGELYEWLMETLLRSIQAEHPPAAWAKDWFALIEADPIGDLDYRDVLAHCGESFKHAYSQHVTQAWLAFEAARTQAAAKAAAATPQRRRNDGGFDYKAWELDHQRRKLRRRYLRALEHTLDTTSVIAEMHASTISTQDWQELIDFCESHNRHREAMHFAQLAAQADPKNARIQTQLLQCYLRDGWDEEALALSEQMLHTQPSANHLEQYLQCAQALGQSKQEALQAQIQHRLAKHTPPNIDIPLLWLVHLRHYQAALDLLATHGPDTASNRALSDLACVLPKALHEDAVRLLQTVVHRLLPHANSPYQEELSWVRQAVARMPSQAAQAWIQDMLGTYRHKTNFVKALRELQKQVCASSTA